MAQGNGSSVIPFDPHTLANALQQTARSATPNAAFLRMDKSGTWAFGVDAEEPEAEQEFLVNPGGFGHGNILWTDPDKVKVAEKLGETYVPVTEGLPPVGPVPPTGRSWEFQLGMALKGYKGTLDGTDMIYRSSSVGGKRAIASLAQLISAKLRGMADDAAIVPVITLDSDSYLHKKYGKLYVPIFHIQRWVKMPSATQPPTPAPKSPAEVDADSHEAALVRRAATRKLAKLVAKRARR